MVEYGTRKTLGISAEWIKWDFNCVVIWFERTYWWVIRMVAGECNDDRNRIGLIGIIHSLCRMQWLVVHPSSINRKIECAVSELQSYFQSQSHTASATCFAATHVSVNLVESDVSHTLYNCHPLCNANRGGVTFIRGELLFRFVRVAWIQGHAQHPPRFVHWEHSSRPFRRSFLFFRIWHVRILGNDRNGTN